MAWKTNFWSGESVVEKMDGMELNLEGVKFKLSAVLPLFDDFEGMKKEREEAPAFGHSEILMLLGTMVELRMMLKTVGTQFLASIQGSRLRTDYEVIWDKNGFFQNSRSQVEDRRWMPVTGSRNNRNQPHGPWSQASRFISDDPRRKRFKE